MVYLRLQSDETIVGVEAIECPEYVRYEPRTDLVIACPPKMAQGIISKNGTSIYQLHNQTKLKGIEEPLLDAFFIDEYDYEMLKNQFEAIDDVEPIEEDSDPGEPGNENYNLTRAELVAKVIALEAKVNTAMSNEANTKYHETIADPSTTSIAKIRAASKQYLEDTNSSEVEEK